MIKQFFLHHFEWMALATGLAAIALMNPYEVQGTSWCLLEWAGFPFCPGEGLGHSIAYAVRGDLANAFDAHIMGPVAILILTGRIGYLLNQTLKPIKSE